MKNHIKHLKPKGTWLLKRSGHAFKMVLALVWRKFSLKFKVISHRIHGAAIYGNIYHQYTPMLAYIPYMDPMGILTTISATTIYDTVWLRFTPWLSFLGLQWSPVFCRKSQGYPEKNKQTKILFFLLQKKNSGWWFQPTRLKNMRSESQLG